MFRCQECNINVNGKENHIVVERRKKFYHYYVVKVKKSFGKTEEVLTEDDSILKNRENKLIKEYSSKGWEIVKELKVCQDCYLASGRK